MITIDGDQGWDEVDELCGAYAREIAQKNTFFTIVHFKKYLADARQAKQLGIWHRVNADDLRRYCGGVAMVAPDRLFKVALRAFLLVTPFPFPHIICKDLNSAEDWVAHRMAVTNHEKDDVEFSIG